MQRSNLLLFLAVTGRSSNIGKNIRRDSALAGLQVCCLPSDRHWSAKEVFDQLDRVTGTRVFEQLYNAQLHSSQFPDLAQAYALLGLDLADGRLLDAATMIEPRDAIMRGG